MSLFKSVKPLFLILFFVHPLCSISQENERSIDSNGVNEFYHENGQLASKGKMEDGMPVGHWKNYYPNGRLRSEGERKKGKLDSLWNFYSEKGVLEAKIWYEEGKKDSISKIYSKEGFLEQKVFYEAGKKEGVAFHYYPDGTKKRRIPYENGKKDGTAFEYNEEGRIINLLEYREGKLRKKEAINRKDEEGERIGEWKSFYSNGQLEWEGYFQTGKKHGVFKYYDEKGEVEEIRKYDNGKRLEDSEDLMVLDTKKKYYEDGTVKMKGTYRPDGTEHGIFKYFDENGEIEKTEVYDDGNLTGRGVIDGSGYYQGEWVHYYPKGGKRAEGKYVDGRKEGEWTYYYRDGDVEQVGSYAAGDQMGTWKWYYPNGDLHRKESYRMDEEDGKSVEYNREGKVINEGEYIDGKKNGEWTYEVGDHIEKGEYIDGNRDGVWKHYYKKNEQLKFEGEYLDGTPKGEHVYYYPNGKKMLEGSYEMGERHGTWKRYDRTGRVILRIEYENGVEKRVEGKKIEPELSGSVEN